MSEWLKDYLKDRQQYTVVNGKQSDYAKVTYRIPQGSVLCPILFTLYTNDMVAAVTSGTVYLYADDTTVYRIAETIDQVTVLLNTLTAHLTKCEAMLLYRGSFTSPLNVLPFGNE